MRHLFLQEADQYKVALLMKYSSFNKQELIKNYFDPLQSMGIPHEDVIAFTLEYDENKKAPVKHIKEYLGALLPILEHCQVKYLYVSDSAFFKILTKQSKAEVHHGYVLPCAIKGFEYMNVVLGINYQALIYNPELQSKMDLGLNALVTHTQDNYTLIGSNIIHSAQYPETVDEIRAMLLSLHQYPELTADIEAFSLRFWDAGIGTIAFAWDEHNGLAFACDYSEFSFPPTNSEGLYGLKLPNPAIRKLLLKFFIEYKGKITWHNATYDVEVIVFTLWMQDMLDTHGLLTGLDIMCRAFDDTKIIAYLATNSTAGNVLGLKPLAHEFAGNYAKEDIKDIRRIPLEDLRQYNLVDALSTWFVKKKFYPIMVRDNQEKLYQTLMLPSLKVLMQTEMTGMPMDTQTVVETRKKLEAIADVHRAKIRSNTLIKTLNLIVQNKAMVAENSKLKTKQHSIEKYAELEFNPGSGPQLRELLYTQMGLPVLDKTDTGLPATGGETIEKLINHTDEPKYKELLTALIELAKVSTILSTFMPAFEKGVIKSDGMQWLHGNFNLGGTVSGRLSSSDPNLQNIPAGSDYGAMVKENFRAPKGWLFVGADFNSLEDMISALTTKDPNKLKVYTDGFDGHCLRAAFYFPEDLSHVDLSSPASVNKLKKTHPQHRQDSKAPTFLLTYGGTYHGMMSNLGWDKEKSQRIEANYHKLYHVSDEYIQARLAQANKDGYVEVAFGLKLRTPLIKQVMWGSKKMPYEAAAEGRTAGNAMGQSYGLLNNRALNEFMAKVWASKYRYMIKPVALIHDAIYLLIVDDIEVVEWTNRELIKSMQWQELPEIQHDTVKLGAALDIFWPSWAAKLTLPNNATAHEIIELCIKHKANPYEQ